MALTVKTSLTVLQRHVTHATLTSRIIPKKAGHCIWRRTLTATSSSQNVPPNHIWRHPVTSVPIPNDIDLTRYTLDFMGRHGDKMAMVEGPTGRGLTYAQLQTDITRVGSALVKMGVVPNDVVSIMLPNCIEYPAIFLAIIGIGAIASPLNPYYTSGELQHPLKQARSKVLFTDPNLLPVVTAALQECPDVKTVITVGSATGYRPYANLLEDDGSAFPDDLGIHTEKHVAALPFSSGTTGLPKGVMLSNYNLIANVAQMTEASITRAVGSAGCVMGVLPFYHIYGLMVIMCAHLKLGGTMVTLPKFEPELFLKSIQDFKIDFLHLAPPLILFLAKHDLVSKYDLTSLSNILSAAAPLGQEVCEEVMARLPKTKIRQAYGMTESSPLTHGNPFEKFKLSSIGTVVPQTEGKIVDVNSGESLPPFKEGEICSRGPQVMLGYHENEKATADTIDKDGWLHSGDIGYVDDEGYFYVTDRLKELIKVKGFQVAPAELEALLVTHPAVMDAAVVGVPDDRAGEIPRAFVVIKPDAQCSEKDIESYVEERVTRHKRLVGGVSFIDAVPKSASGKILRKKLRTS